MIKCGDLKNIVIMSSHPSFTKSLAILPFRSHQNRETAGALLSDGLAESLAMRLHKVSGLKVTPTGSVRKYLSQEDDSFSLGKLLTVDYILEGYIFPADERTRFTVQLLNVPDRSVLWAAQFDETETDVFLLEDQISARIVQAILPHLELAEKDPITDSVTVQDTGEVEEDEIAQKSGAETLVFQPEKTKTKKTEFRVRLAVLLILSVILGGFLIWRWNSSRESSKNDAETPTLIILPYQNKGANQSDNSLGIGLAETLTGNFGSIKKLFVLSPNAGRDAVKLGFSDSQIERDFNVKYILRGNILHSVENNEIQLYSELINAGDKKVLWSKTFNTSDDDIGDVLPQIFDGVLKTLEIKVTSPEKLEISGKLTKNGLAYELYLVGRYQMATRSHIGLHKAISAFEQALEKDADFALAYTGLADAYALENLYEVPPPPDSYRKAKNYALKALELDENSAQAHASLGNILANGEQNRADAEREFRRAIELNPSYATAHHWFAILLSMMGNHDAALAEIELAKKLDPRSAIITSATGMINFYARRYDQAIINCEKSLSFDPGLVPAHKVMRWIFQAQNNYPRSFSAFQKEKNFSGSGDAPGWLVLEAQVEALSADKSKAQAILNKALSNENVSEEPEAFGYEIALAYAALDNPDKTIEWLEKAAKANSHGINFLEVEPRFDKYRSDERFVNLVKKLRRP